jgi:N-glycosylase/DNA lyase
MILRLRVIPFSLQDTMECGQFFRFTRSGGTYIVQSSGRIFSLWQRGETLFSEGVEEPFLVQFLRLDEDLVSILREIDQDSVIHQAIQKYRGLRLIRQDPWECLVSYLCSSAKSILRFAPSSKVFESSGRKFLKLHRIRVSNLSAMPLLLTSNRLVLDSELNI